jgi:large subunit ribosomal protein L4
MKISIYNTKGEKTKDITLSAAFDVKVSPKVVTQYINYLHAALRFPIANTKDRSEVSGGGKKPYKQKGTGRARAGSSRSPLWVGGGVTFGPSNDQNFHKRINSRVKRQAILSVIASQVKAGNIVGLENAEPKTPKTKDAATTLENLKVEGKINVIAGANEPNTLISFRNIAGVTIMTSKMLSIPSVISADKIIATEAGIKELEETYSSKRITN